jgi:hypothetical protein
VRAVQSCDRVTTKSEFLIDGHTRDVLIDEKGAVVEIEEQVALESLPSAVKNGLQTFAGKDKILEVESLTKKARFVALGCSQHLQLHGGYCAERKLRPSWTVRCLDWFRFAVGILRQCDRW